MILIMILNMQHKKIQIKLDLNQDALFRDKIKYAKPLFPGKDFTL